MSGNNLFHIRQKARATRDCIKLERRHVFSVNSTERGERGRERERGGGWGWRTTVEYKEIESRERAESERKRGEGGWRYREG